MHCLPLLPPLALLLWHLHLACPSVGVVAPNPATAEPWSWLCCCMFLPASVPPILASSSRCRAPFQLSLHAAF